nr:hypothetical protein B0A51_04459 [Rachicladosporium sp. CCFEE 5018]
MAPNHEISSSDGERDAIPLTATANLSLGHDNAADARVTSNQVHQRLGDPIAQVQNATLASRPSRSPFPRYFDPENPDADHHVHLPYSQPQARLLLTSQLPVSSPEPVPHSLQSALANRFPAHRFEAGGDLDPNEMPPIFLHDVLMLPGSLANIIGKASPQDIIHQLTPARVNGLRTFVQPKTTLPILSPYIIPGQSAHGLLFFGSGRRSRKRIERHYQPSAQRVEVEATYEVVVAGRDEGQETRLEQRTVMASVYVWSCSLFHFAAEPDGSRGWTLEDFLAGTYDAQTIYYDYEDPEYYFHGLREEGAFELTGPTAEIPKRVEVEMGSDLEAEEAGKAVAVSMIGCFVSVEDICDETVGDGKG